VIRSFRDPGTEDVFNGLDTATARRVCPRSIWAVARRKLDQLNRVRELRDLSIPPGNRLEPLRGTRQGQHSIRINDQYRVCFRWEAGDAQEVEITDYH
jgi:proteic killer suppression protein